MSEALHPTTVDLARDGEIDGEVLTGEILPAERGSLESVPLSEAEARTLTEHIKTAAETTMVLLGRAHAGKAWLALGYGTFAEYVKAEFGFGRARAYQLLDAEKIRLAIESAVPDGTEFRLTEATARDLKKIAGEVVDIIEERTDGMDREGASAMVEEILAEQRALQQEAAEIARAEQEEDAAQRRGNAEYGDGPYTPPPVPEPVEEEDAGFSTKDFQKTTRHAYEFYMALSSMVALPSPESIISVVPVERRFQIDESLRPTIEWLETFRGLWEAQVWQQDDLGD